MSSEGGPQVWTVNGPLEPADVGVALPHEHLLLDGSCFFLQHADDADGSFAGAPVDERTIEQIRASSCSNRDNLMLDDVDLAVAELRQFTDLGGRTIVDMTTSHGLGRDAAGLRRIAELAGVNVVMGSGYYCEYSHPDHVADASADDLTAFMIGEIGDGLAGVIGEIGVNGQERGTLRQVGDMTRDEEKVLRAAVQASLATGAALVVHQPNRSSASAEILRVLAEEGARPERTVLGHMSSVPDFDAHLETLERGFYIAYDNFGMELHNAWYRPIGDEQRMDWTLEVVRRGFAHRLLLSHDVWCKVQLRRYGGKGYGHVLGTIVPALRERGLSDADVRRLTVDNPAEVLAF